MTTQEDWRLRNVIRSVTFISGDSSFPWILKLVPVVSTWEEKKLKKNQPNQQRVLENLLLTIDTLQNRNFRLSTICHGVRVRNALDHTLDYTNVGT